jgi:hypothetical protein
MSSIFMKITIQDTDVIIYQVKLIFIVLVAKVLL